MPMLRSCCLTAVIATTLVFAPHSHAQTSAQAMPETMTMLRHAIAAKTVEGQGNVPAFAQYLAGKLESAGFAKSDIQIIPVGDTAALVARYRGTGAGKPILISAHMDVVAAKADEWKDHAPFKLVKRGKHLYGRGVADMKTNVIAIVETMMRLKREGFEPSHDMILVFSGDEETSMASTAMLAKKFHDAEFLLNGDAGGGVLSPQGKPVIFEIQAAEKSYADFTLTTHAPGGHSSEPNPDNAINRLATALTRVAGHQFPVRHSDITLASFKANGKHNGGPLAAAMRAFAANPDDAKAAAKLSSDPAYVGQLRTTCIATMLKSGHALNALPETATANINCRIFPGVSVAHVKTTLEKVINDPRVAVTLPDPSEAAPPSPLRTDVIHAVKQAVHARYPGVTVVPGMSNGATDSKHFRLAGVPSYGVNPIFSKAGAAHAHGRGEKILASEVPAALTYWHSLLTQLAK